MKTLNVLISAVIQIVLFAAIPFLVWVIKKRKEIGFFKYIGLKKPRFIGKWRALLLIAAVYFLVYNFDSTAFIPSDALEAIGQNSSVSANQYAGLGMTAILPILISTFIQNGFCEELLFRGFLCKRLMEKLGTVGGCVSQAVIFALIHNVMFLFVTRSLAFHLVIFVTITLMTSLLAILNEKMFDGSIWPSVILHGLGNFISTMLVAFSLR